ncbi:3-deoxy-manno-octulosonate cytidylyltransferase [Candidatus Photodesmus katoptron]|uniref:3-deoxy-manno-octulosonate cytidylyltransferase n=1 Tax=Candidatus Photodesmus katoptron Akat1 TaxID=1236703 RepID=S3DJE0_9GAMM|nr:3-deoxy-manno-octulosonate cytidylyltransferase [Candidatus Photodesmus katoptron]EPE37795.1 3-deoxy-D-manno-octulosonate cytidylyltransferase [Candidatus Photodesmus katoptron Akat1]KEY90484.1 3-deoxy-manno-octulosonate cytidylyltransferase [Candidatus Photodesmus katoptron]
MTFTVIIPARYYSTRLPGKPIIDILGKPMVRWVYDSAMQSGASKVIIATDDQRIARVVNLFGGKVCMTSSKHQSGTERLAEVVNMLRLSDNHTVINVQCDEPLIPPSIITQVANSLSSTDASMATLAVEIVNKNEVFNSNVVKVLMNKDGYAIYFSRAPIPWDKVNFSKKDKKITYPLMRHIGIYAYKASFINTYMNWKSTILEHIESLEQLRVLWYGEKIYVNIAKDIPIFGGIDTFEDLKTIREMLK